MPAEEFFIGPMVTSIEQGQCIRAIRFPVWPHRRIGIGFVEVSARRSDFAFVSAAAQVALDEEGRCLDIALGLGGVADRPLRLDMSALVGAAFAASEAAAVIDAAFADIEVMSDLHASATYRRRVAGVLGLRALEQARDEAAAKPAKGAR
jgi:carbon-monoxide dehydrogenase medium subunit